MNVALMLGFNEVSNHNIPSLKPSICMVFVGGFDGDCQLSVGSLALLTKLLQITSQLLLMLADIAN